MLVIGAAVVNPCLFGYDASFMARRSSASPPAPSTAAAPRRTRRTAADPSTPHRQTRRARASELAEDYAEIIAELIDTSGEARVTDIARRIGVSHVTVIRTIARLQEKGWVTSRPYRSIFLTEAGRRLAEKARRRHQIVLDFLLALGVSDAAARADAEGIEHHVSKETLSVFERFTREAGRG